MYKDHKIAVVVPAYNEEDLILETLSGIPVYVDSIIVVNDASADKTAELLQRQSQADSRIRVITHETNKGLGQSLIDGYVDSKNSDLDITAVMAGDNQMHPDDLVGLLDKLIEEGFDYVKGNRLLHQNIYLMPRYRFFGNAILTILTKFATGYYPLMDPQCGYTAIKNSALKVIPIEKMTQGYGYNADILCMLNIHGFRVTDTQVRPVYDREKSKIKLWKYIPKTSWLLVRLFFRRLWQRYVVLDFHPLVLFYFYAIFNLVFIALPLTARFLFLYFDIGEAPKTTLTILVFALMTAFQSILFAIWMDMDYNRKK
ncbi:MAG: glycosyltransferase family 2 protein [Anaerolineae bacterium]|nr:glycosyltransferase family 2 protein [Anaerolineae bacterium]